MFTLRARVLTSTVVGANQIMYFMQPKLIFCLYIGKTLAGLANNHCRLCAGLELEATLRVTV